MSILYPVAPTAEAALHAPSGAATREREAAAVACGPVRFEQALVGPGYRSREQAMDAYAGRIEDDRPGAPQPPSAEARWCELAAVAVEGRALPPPVQPHNRDGRRWPIPPTEPTEVVWRLRVSYWRIVGEAERPDLPAARRARRDAGQAALDGRALQALAAQPLRPFKLQRPLDVGLFEVRPPEAPHRLIPDE